MHPLTEAPPPSTIRRRTVLRVLVLLAALIALLPFVTSSGPAPATGVPTSAFEWGDAAACAVDGARDEVRCYASEAEMDAAEAEIPPAIVAGDGDVMAAALRCDGWIKLYDSTYFGGRTLYFRDMHWWQQLSTYGFENRAESLRTSDCQVTVATRDYGQGTLRTYRGGYRSFHDLSYHNNRVSSIYIQK